MDTLTRDTFEQIIEDDRAQRVSTAWQGTLLDYLALVQEDPLLVKLAHRRLYDMISAEGMSLITESDDPRVKKLYKDEPLKVPYNLRLSEEVKIYQKALRKSDFRAHVAPHTLEMASMFAVLSRLEPSPKCDPMTKLRLYNGEEVVEKGRTKKVDMEELREEAKREGMRGISTRFIMKALDNALAESGRCINPINVREAMINMVKDQDISDDTRKQYLEFLQDTLHKEYLDLLEKEITKAFVYSYQEQAETLFQNYLDHAEAYANRTKVKDRNTKEELQPDEGFLKSVEEQIAIIGAAADGFRQEVIAYLWASVRRGEKVSYQSYEPLKAAIEKKLMSSVRDMSRIITKARTRDEEQKDKYTTMVQSLLDNGYCEYCVDVVLKYAANNLWKDRIAAGSLREKAMSATIFRPHSPSDSLRSWRRSGPRLSPISLAQLKHT